MMDSSTRAVIIGSTFTGNAAPLSGGAIWSTEGNLYISSSTFAGNTAGDGGSAGRRLQAERADADAASGVVPRRRLQSGSGYASHGGAIYALETFLEVHTTTFTANRAFDAGGAVWSRLSTVSFDGCTLLENEAHGR